MNNYDPTATKFIPQIGAIYPQAKHCSTFSLKMPPIIPRDLLAYWLTKLIFRKKYDPKAYSAEGGLIFDAAVQRLKFPLSFSRCNILLFRWHALQFTYGDHFKPTFTNFIKYSCTGAIPVFLYYQWCWGPHHKVDYSTKKHFNLTPFVLLQEYSRAVRRGEVAYDADSRRIKYFN